MYEGHLHVASAVRQKAVGDHAHLQVGHCYLQGEGRVLIVEGEAAAVLPLTQVSCCTGRVLIICLECSLSMDGVVVGWLEGPGT